MAVLNSEQRRYIQDKINTFLRMEDFKYKPIDVNVLLNNIYKKKKFSANPKYVGFENGNPESGRVYITFDPTYLPITTKVKKMQDDIKKERDRRSSIVKSIQEKMIFGAQAEEMQKLLALLK